MKIALLLAAAYIAGSVNFSILLFRLLGRDDPRRRFSGNAGATNVCRQAGLFWAGVVFLLDMGRALAISWGALHWLSAAVIPWMGLSFIVGVRYPCFHEFRGGKGVAGYLGFIALISPLTASLSALVWVIVYGMIRIPFVASFFMVAVLAAGTIITRESGALAAGGTIATALFILYNHRQNVAALLQGRAAWEKRPPHRQVPPKITGK